MSEPVGESYEVLTEDPELHAISVMLRALDRHVDRRGWENNSEENIRIGHLAMLRCVTYVMERIQGYGT
jgi:hypothetical protein